MGRLPPDFGPRNSIDSWGRRVADNLIEALENAGVGEPATDGPHPFSLVEVSVRGSSSQTISVLTHFLVFGAALILVSARPPSGPFPKPDPIRGIEGPILRNVPPEWRAGISSLGLHGRGGSDEPLPARKGLLAPASVVPLAPPRLVREEHLELPAPPAVFDANAPLSVPTIANLGLPWMNRDTNSAGPGKGHGIGNRGGDGMGDDFGDGAGEGEDAGNYANVSSHAACLYCPEPPYSDEARKAKLQGMVTLRVLIGSDGRAKRVQIVKGLGMGLDENALEAIRNWRFAPARDARRQPVASWATIETRFQLF
jgi:protein TonB